MAAAGAGGAPGAAAAAAAGRWCLEGRAALVTGAARGIGRAVAGVLAGRGAAVALADVDGAGAAAAAAELRGRGARALGVTCDAGDAGPAGPAGAVRAAVREFGRLDVAVANAGIVRQAPFLEMSPEDFDEVLRVNLRGVFLTGQAAGRQMVAQGGGGAIVNMSSVNGTLAIPELAGYNASKGGVDNLTRCMALALAPHGVRVNAAAPGSVLTDVLRSVAGDPEKMRGVLARTPLGRAAEPCEVAEVVAFLCSDAASYVTGHVLFADGGRLALNYAVPAPP